MASSSHLQRRVVTSLLFQRAKVTPRGQCYDWNSSCLLGALPVSVPLLLPLSVSALLRVDHTRCLPLLLPSSMSHRGSLYGPDGRIRIPAWTDVSAERERRSLLPTEEEQGRTGIGAHPPVEDKPLPSARLSVGSTTRPGAANGRVATPPPVAQSPPPPSSAVVPSPPSTPPHRTPTAQSTATPWEDPDADDSNFGIRVGGLGSPPRPPGGGRSLSPPPASFVDALAGVGDGMDEDAKLAQLLQDEEDAVAKAAGIAGGVKRQRAAELADDERLARALQAAEDEAGSDDSFMDGLVVEGEDAEDTKDFSSGGRDRAARRKRRAGLDDGGSSKDESPDWIAGADQGDGDDDDDNGFDAGGVDEDIVVHRRPKRPAPVAPPPATKPKPSPWAMSRPPLGRSKRQRVAAKPPRKATAFGDLPDDDDLEDLLAPPRRPRKAAKPAKPAKPAKLSKSTKSAKSAKPAKRARGPAWLPEDSDSGGDGGSIDDFMCDSADEAAASTEEEALPTDASLSDSDEEAEEAAALGGRGRVPAAVLDASDSDDYVAAAKAARRRRLPTREASEEPAERTELSLSVAVERAEVALVAASDDDAGNVVAFPDASDDGELHLKPHQLEGVRWMLGLRAAGRSGILADEMGLGKTVQTLVVLVATSQAAAVAAKANGKGKAPLVPVGRRGGDTSRHPRHLVIVPLSVVGQWETESATWFPKSLTTYVHSGAPDVRLGEGFEAALAACDVFVTSYELALRDVLGVGGGSGTEERFAEPLASLRSVSWEYVVVDEAQRLKRSTSRLPASLRRLAHERMLLLTGTPLANNVGELWSLLSFVAPNVFGGPNVDVVLDDAEESFLAFVIKRMHTAVKPFMLRRTKADISASPVADGGSNGGSGAGGSRSAQEVQVRLAPSALQVALARYLSMSASANSPSSLRRVAMHPWLLSPALSPPVLSSLDVDGPPSAHNSPSVLVPPSAKLRFLHYALPRLVAAGHQVLIFSGMTATLDLIARLLQHGLNLPFVRLDGGVSRDARAAAVAAFAGGTGSRGGSLTRTRSPSPAVAAASPSASGEDDITVVGSTPAANVSVFLLSTKAGGLGLNLQSADTVILADSDANPAADAQAVARADRMGQNRAVLTLRLCVQGSVDERVAAASKGKRALAAAVFGGGGDRGSMAGSAASSRRASPSVDVDAPSGGGGVDAETAADTDTSAVAIRWDALLARDDSDAKALRALPRRKVLPLGDADGVPSWLAPDVEPEVTRRALDTEDSAAAAVEARAAAADVARAAALAAKGQRATRSGRVFAGARRRGGGDSGAGGTDAAGGGSGGSDSGEESPRLAAARASRAAKDAVRTKQRAWKAAATPTARERVALAELDAMGFAMEGAPLLDALRSARGNVTGAIDALLAWQVEVQAGE